MFFFDMGVGYFWYLDSCTFKKQRARRGDYTFHCYSELCQFVYCLLTRSRKVSSLPEMNSWEDYMDSEKIASFPKTSDATFLCNFEFGEVLRQRNTSEVKDFRTRCRRFIDRLVDVILSKLLVSSDFLQGVYCFCPELLLGGDDHCVFTLFSRLMRVLEESGAVSSAESRSAVEEFATFVVDVRARHLSSGQQSEDIADVISYLLADYGFLARKSLCHVFKLCCLMIRRPLPHYPQVDISLNGCDDPSSIVTSNIRGIQSYVSTSHYQQGLPWSVFVLLSRGRKISWYKLILILGVECAVMVMQFLWNASRICLKIILHVVRRELMIACIVLIVQDLLEIVILLVLLGVVEALLRLLSLLL